MTMTHKEALERAMMAFAASSYTNPFNEIEAAIRTYVEARGLALVPMKATDGMREAGERWSVMPGQVWDDMIDASPDPFAQEERA